MAGPSNVMKSVSTWKGGALFEHVPPSGVTYATDARLQAFPKESPDGPGPMEVLLGALTGCTGIDIVNILTKMRMEVRSFRLEADAERVPTDPRIFTKINIVYELETEPVDTAKVLRAIGLSSGKYCSVSTILGASADVTYTLRYAGEEHHGVMHKGGTDAEAS
jgi:putative redox protein